MTRENDPRVHPYIPNSAPTARERMLREIGVDDVSVLYEAIPAELRLGTSLRLPEPCRSEHELRRHVTGLLAKNQTCDELLSFLGAGCYQHAVPAVCDEINTRGEFLTAYGGLWYSDHGKMQAYFEYQSLMGELLDMDAVSLTTYDWSSAATTAVLMAARLTDRTEVLIPRNLDPERFAQMDNFARSAVTIRQVDFDPATGSLDLVDLRDQALARHGGRLLREPHVPGRARDAGG